MIILISYMGKMKKIMWECGKYCFFYAICGRKIVFSLTDDCIEIKNSGVFPAQLSVETIKREKRKACFPIKKERALK